MLETSSLAAASAVHHIVDSVSRFNEGEFSLSWNVQRNTLAFSVFSGFAYPKLSFCASIGALQKPVVRMLLGIEEKTRHAVTFIRDPFFLSD